MDICTEVLDFIPLACCHFDRTGILRYVNVEALKLFCKGQEDCIGKSLNDIFSEGLAEVCEKALNNVLNQGTVNEIDFLSPITDRWTRLTATPGITGVVMSFVDIHDLKSAEYANNQFKLFVTASSNMVYRMSADWKYMYHLSGDNMLGANGQGTENWMAKYIPEADQHLVEKRITQAIHSKSIFELEHRVLMPDGIGWMYSRAVPVFDKQNEIVEWLIAGSDITKRMEGENALRESEARFRTSSGKYLSLFNTIDQGFCVIKVFFDDRQKASDYQFLEVNPAFEAQTGLKNIIGKNMRALAPYHEEHWFSNYGKVALTGIPVRFEAEAVALKRWFDVYAFSIDEPGRHHVALLFNDITGRKKLEDRQTFLLKLSDALRPLSDSVAILSVSMQLLVDYLALNQAQFYEVASDDGYLTAAGGYPPDAELFTKHVRMEDFGVDAKKLFCEGKTVVIKDALNDTGMITDGKSEFQSLIAVPIVKEGRFVASMCLYHSTAHDWSAHEISVAEETAQRIWSAFELTKIEEALRKTELRLYTVLQQAPIAIAISGSSGEILFRNQVFDKLWGRPAHDTTARFFSDFYKGFHLDGKAIVSEDWPGSRAVLEGKVIDSQVLEIVRQSGERIFCAFNAAPIRDEQGSITGGVVLFRNVTAERSTEAALRASEEKYRNELEKEIADRTRELQGNFALLQTIFDTNLIGMSVFSPVWDNNGELIDFRILIVNKLIVNAVGRDDIVGKLYTELFPGVKQMGLFDVMVNTFKTGMHGKMDYHYTYEGIDRWYSTMFVKGDDILVSTNLDITERIEAEHKLREMEARQQQEIFQVTLNTQEQERRRVSESLHNGLGQLLYGTKLSLNYLSPTTAVENTDKYIQAKRYTEDLLTEAIRETRRISHELMPTVLAEFGLKVAIKEVCDQLQNGLRFSCSVVLGNVKLDNYLELAVFRTVQELMINVVKHAKATQALVSVVIGDTDVKIQVKDNGQGMPVGTDDKAGIGLSSIRNKVELLKGTISINCKPAKGTVVAVRFPIFKANLI